MNSSILHAISPIDGRYFAKTADLTLCFSEFSLIRQRLFIEIRWLTSLAARPELTEMAPISERAKHVLNTLVDDFDDDEALIVKDYEKKTNHDVKAVEYYLRDKLLACDELTSFIPFIHFACTSEDINNLAYALMTQKALLDVMRPALSVLQASITTLGKNHAHVAMLGRTHGQAATPTTLGKELINFAARLRRPLQQLTDLILPGKCNGAVGNYNAHVVAYPTIDWREHAREFVTGLGLSFNAYTTQIEPHDILAEMAHIMIRINNILLDYARDIWGYISIGYFKQNTIASEVGSSTMPHKVNPIDFENAEGNLGLSNSLFEHFANKLTQSRWQRDLSDSTVLRNIGVAFAHAQIAYQSIIQGNAKLSVNQTALDHDLSLHWEVLTEALQTVMRRYHVTDAYEQMRDLTRGKAVNASSLHAFIETLTIPEDVKQRLLQLTPSHYTGLAASLVDEF